MNGSAVSLVDFPFLFLVTLPLSFLSFYVAKGTGKTSLLSM